MEACVRQADTLGAQIQVGRNAARVRIPRMELETDYFLLEEQLLSEVCRRSATEWIIDLSEHEHGVTLVLAGILAGICEEVRRRGHTVRCTGIQKPCVACQAVADPARRPPSRAVRESWISMAAGRSSSFQ